MSQHPQLSQSLRSLNLPRPSQSLPGRLRHVQTQPKSLPLTVQLQLEMARIKGFSEMWAVTGKCLMDWARNWQEILDPLNVSNSVKQISSVWGRLGF